MHCSLHLNTPDVVIRHDLSAHAKSTNSTALGKQVTLRSVEIGQRMTLLGSCRVKE